MAEQLDCAVVRDLLPNYVEQLTSEKTNILMEEHFKICSDCTKERDNLLYELHTEKIPDQKELKKYMNKTKIMYFCKGGLLTVGLIGVFVTGIVDLAVNHKLSWSLIVIMSIAYVAAIIVTLMRSKKDRIAKTLGAASILILPMLLGIQTVINANYVAVKMSWVQKMAFPIVLICLIVVWIPYGVMKLLQKGNQPKEEEHHEE